MYIQCVYMWLCMYICGICVYISAYIVYIFMYIHIHTHIHTCRFDLYYPGSKVISRTRLLTERLLHTQTFQAVTLLQTHRAVKIWNKLARMSLVSTRWHCLLLQLSYCERMFSLWYLVPFGCRTCAFGWQLLLFRMAHKCRAEALSSIPKHRRLWGTSGNCEQMSVIQTRVSYCWPWAQC